MGMMSKGKRIIKRKQHTPLCPWWIKRSKRQNSISTTVMASEAIDE